MSVMISVKPRQQMLVENGDVLQLCWINLANKTKVSQDFPRNILLSSATSEPPLGYEEAHVAIKRRSHVFHSN